MSSVYQWTLYLHILSIIGFLAAHGIAIGVVLKLRKASTAEESRALLNLSRSSVGILHGALFAVLITGVTLGFLGGWWSQTWIWVALVILFSGWGIMGLLGTRYYDRARRSLGIETFYGPKDKEHGSAAATRDPAATNEILTSSRSLILTIVGATGLVFMLWLMFFKPF